MQDQGALQLQSKCYMELFNKSTSAMSCNKVPTNKISHKQNKASEAIFISHSNWKAIQLQQSTSEKQNLSNQTKIQSFSRNEEQT